MLALAFPKWNRRCVLLGGMEGDGGWRYILRVLSSTRYIKTCGALGLCTRGNGARRMLSHANAVATAVAALHNDDHIIINTKTPPPTPTAHRARSI